VCVPVCALECGRMAAAGGCSCADTHTHAHATAQWWWLFGKRGGGRGGRGVRSGSCITSTTHVRSLTCGRVSGVCLNLALLLLLRLLLLLACRCARVPACY
jgi:hypothetical protein